ncbi:hypothetical protein BJ165DRAFT_1531512 [Panaeolus papilionaceus]|nr:hypothetical protein BJ165DRAFT_1531512 [Panaeolus papilionaceus]
MPTSLRFAFDNHNYCSYDLGNGTALLRPRTKNPVKLQTLEKAAVDIITGGDLSAVRKWGRILLKNGQVACSFFSESRRSSTVVNTWNTRNVKAKINSKYIFCEVQFYFLHELAHDGFTAFALISQYSDPGPTLLEQSYHTVVTCEYRGNTNYKVIPVSTITAVILMQPLPKKYGEMKDLWFVVEKSGLDDMNMIG